MKPTYEQKLAILNENKDFAIFNELSDVNDKLEKIVEREAPEMPEPLEAVSITNFPDTQKVEVTNFPTMPEHKTPIVNVAAPIVKVDAPIVKVDNQAVADEIAKITELLSKEENKSEIEKVKVLDSEGKLVDFKGLFNSLGEKIGQIRVSGGGGPSEIWLKNNTQNRINPATSEKQDSQITELQAIKTAVQNIDIDADTINLNTDQLEAKLDTLNTHLANVVSTVNSTSTPLGISGVFTGTAEDITKYAAVSVTVKSDQASATNGLSIQFSTDGTNWDNVDTHTISAGVSHTVTNAVQSKYFRVVYTNGGTAQTYIRLQVLYSTEAVGPIIEEMGGDVSDTTSTLTTKAVLFAKNPAGAYGSINRTTGGNLKMSLEEVDPAVVLPTKEKGLSGASVNGTRALTLADTWYAVPSTVPTADYVLVASIENSAGTIRFGFSNTGTPSVTNGNLAPAHLEIKLSANQVIYFASSVGGDDINFSTKQI